MGMEDHGIIFLKVAVFGLLTFFGISACRTAKNITEKPSYKNVRDDVVRAASSRIGSSYKYAGKGPRVFDCSGLVQYAFAKAGYSLPASSEVQSGLGASIVLSSAMPGDLIFFKKNGEVFHVSIITKVTRKSLYVVHSTSSRGVISQDILASNYWKSKIFKVISLTDIVNQ